MKAWRGSGVVRILGAKTTRRVGSSVQVAWCTMTLLTIEKIGMMEMGQSPPSSVETSMSLWQEGIIYQATQIPVDRVELRANSGVCWESE